MLIIVKWLISGLFFHSCHIFYGGVNSTGAIYLSFIYQIFSFFFMFLVFPGLLGRNNGRLLDDGDSDEGNRKGGQVRFTHTQSTELERVFTLQKYVSPQERKSLARSIDLSERQVKTWFQNRRAKWRRIKLEDEMRNRLNKETYENNEKVDHVIKTDHKSTSSTTEEGQNHFQMQYCLREEERLC